ncbi:MAG: hypothetical protein P1V97_29060 [Planctomycetota bacterium]|nr:hypothetical protein [Planctomycetota bacterium]
MTLSNKGSRPIIVDGVDYRWMVASRNGPIRLVVEASNVKGQRFCVTFPFGDYYLDTTNRWWPDVQVRPEHVRKLIRVALERGWRPKETGLAPFELENPEEISHGSGGH